MSTLSDEALLNIQNGLLLERRGKLGEAEEFLALGMQMLRRLMNDVSLGNSQKLVFSEYLKDAARCVQRIRNTLKQERDGEEQKLKQEEQQHEGVGADYLSFLDNVNRDAAAHLNSPSSQRPQRSRAKTPPVKNQKPAFLRVQTHTPPSRQEKSEQKLCGSLSSHNALRTPDFVMKAIDIATALSKQKAFKRAVDVLQHAYDVKKKDRNNPGNFHRVEEHLLLLRREYYSHSKPRFLQDNPVIPEEMEILRSSGVTTTIPLPIWDDLQDGYGRENVFMPCEKNWKDPFTPGLSSSQRSEGAQYLRMSDIKPNVDLCIIRNADPMSVKQTVVGDCSMVCSLIICASYQQRFSKAKIISNVIYPQDENGNPVVNPKGKYCVKMLVNGMTRLITVDDRFPANPRTGALLCTYSSDESELWVSIMEKAFVKVCGGSYEFPGSSSSSDLYKLSGWLPDGVTFDAKDFNADLQWNRLYARHADGSVLITACTATLSRAEEDRLQLASTHAYAVLEMQEIDGIRLIKLKNPWGRRSWSGMYSLGDRRAESVALLGKLQHTTGQADQGIFWITWGDLCKHFARCCLSWNPYMLFKTPEGMSRRPTRLSCHSRFPYTTSTGQMPQFHIGVTNVPRPSRMHLVFSRHITDVEKFSEQFEDNPNVPYIGLKVYDVTRFRSIAQHLGARCTFGICYCRRLAHGSELGVSFQPLHDVVYRNMAAHTLSFNCPAGTSDLIVVVGRTESSVKKEFNFSITLHTEWPQVKLSDATLPPSGVYMHVIPQSNLKHCTTIKGGWIKGVSCGGKIDTQTFVYNPQYSLSLSKASMLSVRLCVPECELSVQVYVVGKELNTSCERVKWLQRVDNLNRGSILLQAPLYGHGGAVVDTSLRSCLIFDKKHLLREEGNQQQQQESRMQTLSSSVLPPLPAGDYTIVPVQWSKGVPAAFELIVETTEPHELREIPQEGTDFLETKVQGTLSGGSAVVLSGAILKNDVYFSSNSRVCIVASSSCVLTARLLLVPHQAPTGTGTSTKVPPSGEFEEGGVATNLSLFYPKNDSTMECVSSSGRYERCAVALQPVKVVPGVTYVLVVSSSNPSRASYVLRLFSSSAVAVKLQ